MNKADVLGNWDNRVDDAEIVRGTVTRMSRLVNNKWGHPRWALWIGSTRRLTDERVSWELTWRVEGKPVIALVVKNRIVALEIEREVSE